MEIEFPIFWVIPANLITLFGGCSGHALPYFIIIFFVCVCMYICISPDCKSLSVCCDVSFLLTRSFYHFLDLFLLVDVYFLLVVICEITSLNSRISCCLYNLGTKMHVIACRDQFGGSANQSHLKTVFGLCSVSSVHHVQPFGFSVPNLR